VVCVILQLRKLVGIFYAAYRRIFADIAITLCEDDELLTREVVLLDRLADDFLRDTVGVDVGWTMLATVVVQKCKRRTSVPGCQPSIVGRLQQWQRLLLLNDPGLPLLISETHASEDWHRHPQTALPQLPVLCLGLLEQSFHISFVCHFGDRGDGV
jgi:hypothetical protein